MNADGTNNKQLTFDVSRKGEPSVSPDGRYIVFTSTRAGVAQVWRMDIDGSNAKQLSNGQSNWKPRCSFDSQSVIYTSYGTEVPTLWKVSIAGGNPVQLTDYRSELLAISPRDGQIAYLTWNNDEQAGPQRRVVVMPFEGGPSTRTFDIIGVLRTVKWTPDGSALTYIDSRGGLSNIWSQPIDGGPPKQLSNFKSDLIFSYAWSQDGKKLALARGSLNKDVVLIRDITHAQ